MNGIRSLVTHHNANLNHFQAILRSYYQSYNRYILNCKRQILGLRKVSIHFHDHVTPSLLPTYQPNIFYIMIPLTSFHAIPQHKRH